MSAVNFEQQAAGAASLPRRFAFLDARRRSGLRVLRTGLLLLALGVLWTLLPLIDGPTPVNFVWALCMGIPVALLSLRFFRRLRRITDIGVSAGSSGVAITDAARDYHLPWIHVQRVRARALGRQACVIVEMTGGRSIEVEGLAIGGLRTPWARHRALARLSAIATQIESLRPAGVGANPGSAACDGSATPGSPSAPTQLELPVLPAPRRRHRWIGALAFLFGVCGSLLEISLQPGAALTGRVDLIAGAVLCLVALLAGALTLLDIRRIPTAFEGARLAGVAVLCSSAGLFALLLQ